MDRQVKEIEKDTREALERLDAVVGGPEPTRMAAEDELIKDVEQWEP